MVATTFKVVAASIDGADVVFHQAALRWTRCQEAPRECQEVMVDGTYNVIEAALRECDGSRERDLDLYRYELAEIDEVAPDPAERDQLDAERGRLRHAEGLREAAGDAHTGAVGDDEDGGGVIVDDCCVLRAGEFAKERTDVIVPLAAFPGHEVKL